MPAKELRFLTMLLSATVDQGGAEKLAAATPLNPTTILKLETEMQEPLDVDTDTDT